MGVGREKSSWVGGSSVCRVDRQKRMGEKLVVRSHVANGQLTKTATPIPTYLHLGTIILDGKVGASDT